MSQWHKCVREEEAGRGNIIMSSITRATNFWSNEETELYLILQCVQSKQCLNDIWCSVGIKYKAGL